MDLAKTYAVLSEQADTGVPVTIGDATFTIAYYNSSKCQMYFISQLEKLKAKMDPDVAVLQAMHDTLVEKVVKTWSNLLEDGVPVNYSKKECRRILETYAGLDIAIMNQSLDLDRYRRQRGAETTEKSMPPLTGSIELVAATTGPTGSEKYAQKVQG